MANIMVNSQAPKPSMASSSVRQSGAKLTHLPQNKIADEVLDGFSVRNLVAIGTKLLADLQIPSPGLEAHILLEHSLGIDRISLAANAARVISLENSVAYFEALKRRLCFEPIAYILGHKEFYGLDFFVNSHCLIPRPDTECVVEKCLELLPVDKALRIADVCTGSGAILVATLVNRPQASGVGLDISAGALAIAQKNAQHHGLASRSTFVHSDLFAKLPAEKFDLIVSNPPYIGRRDLATLAPDLKYEPMIALDGLDDMGLTFYSRILSEAGQFLAVGGFLVMEIGYRQEAPIRALIGKDWQLIEFFADLASNTRGVILTRL